MATLPHRKHESPRADQDPPKGNRRRQRDRRFMLLVPDRTGTPRPIRWRARRTLIVPRWLQRRGLAGYEPETLACFLALLQHAPPGPVWDVGANVGVYAALAATTTDREIVAFEPTPDVAAVVRRVARRNDLAIEVVECALGAAAGSATLYLAKQSDSSNSTAAGFREAAGTLTVAAHTIDELVQSGRTPPAVLKLDTETTEPPILSGGRRTIAEHRPWILCEALPGRTESELMAEMRGHGYTWHLVEPTVPYPARDVIEGHVDYYMWLFAPEPIPETFWDDGRTWQERLEGYVPVPRSDLPAS